MDIDYSSVSIVDYITKLKAQNVPEREYAHRINFFLEHKARKFHIPLLGYYELTPLCNLDCKMCYVHLSTSQYSPDRLLNVNVWKDLTKEAYKIGMRSVTLTGGECLTYPEFEELYLFLHSMHINTYILTNGVLLDDNRVDFFKKFPPKSIQISLYGSSDANYQLVTGHKVFSTVIQNILSLKRSGLPLRIAVTPSNYMQNDIRELFRTIEDLGIPYYVNKMLLVPRRNTNRQYEDLDIEQYIEIYKIHNEMHHINNKPLDSSDLPEIFGKEPSYGLKCGAGRSTFSIRYDGRMYACLGLDDYASFPLTDGFQVAWKMINEYADQYPYPQECNGCIYFDSCHPCPIMHKSAPDRGHCDPRICEKTRRFIQAGILRPPVQLADERSISREMDVYE